MTDFQPAPQSDGELRPSETLRNIITTNNIKNVIPIVSNSFYIDEVLCREQKLTDLISSHMKRRKEDYDEEMNISEQLTRAWAQKIGYPMSDSHNLARVSQYYQVKKDSSSVAKEDYLGFLNSYLLDLNTDKSQFQGTIKRLRPDVRSLPFAEILNQLGYSKLPVNEDPLQLLAKVQFPIYVTTCYHDFLERALIEAGRAPKTQLVFWEEGVEYDDLEDEHRPDPLFRPSAAEPIVYHLFGLEKYPGSLVLSEDDYMKFLVSIATDTDSQHPIVPQKLKEKISSAHLLLLGYHLRDWDFRVLFRFIMEMRKKRSPETVKTGICIQIPPRQEARSLLEYMQRYFNIKRFDTEWKHPKEFARELWLVWEGQLSND